jgi:hypothetical protein
MQLRMRTVLVWYGATWTRAVRHGCYCASIEGFVPYFLDELILLQARFSAFDFSSLPLYSRSRRRGVFVGLVHFERMFWWMYGLNA